MLVFLSCHIFSFLESLQRVFITVLTNKQKWEDGLNGAKIKTVFKLLSDRVFNAFGS